MKLFLNASGWMLAASAPVIYALRGGRNLTIALCFIVLQLLYGLYTWRISAAYYIGKLTSGKST